MAGKTSREKPRKPYPDFPLYAHATGRWAKKIKGKLYYFGPWEDPQAALQKYLAQRDDLQAGRPVFDGEGVTIADACNAFLTAKDDLVASGELSPRTFADYLRTCKELTRHLGRSRPLASLTPVELLKLRGKLAKGRKALALSHQIRHTRMVLKFAYDSGLIDRPVRFGQFKAPSKRVLRAEKNKKPPRMFEAHEIRDILEQAGRPLRAMVLLGVNCGFGQTDCAKLPKSALDLDAGWVDFPRPKTAVPRKCPLWPETIAEIREALALGRTARDDDHANLVFLTRQGLPYVRVNERGGVVDSVGLQFIRAAKAVGHKRPGLSFYALRHTFETIGGDSKDQVAVDRIMGHADHTMADNYRERIEDQRLIDVSNHVRHWLFQG